MCTVASSPSGYQTSFKFIVLKFNRAFGGDVHLLAMNLKSVLCSLGIALPSGYGMHFLDGRKKLDQHTGSFRKFD